MKPAGYPLPWHDGFDVPYYQINSTFGFMVPLWSRYQAKRDMHELIPAIDRLLERFPGLRKRLESWLSFTEGRALGGEA